MAEQGRWGSCQTWLWGPQAWRGGGQPGIRGTAQRAKMKDQGPFSLWSSGSHPARVGRAAARLARGEGHHLETCLYVMAVQPGTGGPGVKGRFHRRESMQSQI